MSGDPSIRPSLRDDTSPRDRFLSALGVPRNGKIGASLGLAFAIAIYVVFAVLPAEPASPPPLLLVLAFVVAVSTAFLVTGALTVRNAARMTADIPKWIKRGGTTGLIGGVLWTVAATPVLLSVGFPESVTFLHRVMGFILPLPPLGICCGAWAIHARNRHTGAYPRLPKELADSLPGINPGDVAGAIGAVAFTTAMAGLLLVATIATTHPGLYLGLPVTLRPSVFVGANLLALVGTSLLGAGALRADVGPRSGPIGLLIAVPVGLAGLTLLAVIGRGDLAPGVLSTVLGLPWVAMGWILHEGGGIPPVERFRPAIVRETPNTTAEASAESDMNSR